MPLITFIAHDGLATEINATSGSSLMHEAVSHGIGGIVGECGGAGACATCHCYLDDASLDRIEQPGRAEKDMLEFVVEPAHNSRLGCQVTVSDALDGAVVRLPASQF
ncbi:2Fe-2S iron-sulfur cluster-binding protein [Massilia cavernae]|uniref:(2Fe-2S)-binding protein n=1 Tax=Massilia cavernae TaxID=2320864 RepID=A0A418Y0U4_9BURK|nr:2Fe-2S iron-sulfur cluster-binding protein [Massilia cavernae]RJG18911.1 (2Fe-2S)-binding protein [Massilia cavernae]